MPNFFINLFQFLWSDSQLSSAWPETLNHISWLLNNSLLANSPMIGMIFSKFNISLQFFRMTFKKFKEIILINIIEIRNSFFLTILLSFLGKLWYLKTIQSELINARVTLSRFFRQWQHDYGNFQNRDWSYQDRAIRSAIFNHRRKIGHFF